MCTRLLLCLQMRNLGGRNFCLSTLVPRQLDPVGPSEYFHVIFSSIQSLSCVQLFATPRSAARQASLSITTSRSSPKLMSTESVMPSNHLILCHPLLLLPSIFPTIRVFSNLHIKWPMYWSFSFISPSSENPELISFRLDWLHLLAVQGTLKSLLQHHSSKSINSSALSLPYSPTHM